jgi:3-phenylpropionate/cinnamic acid dioxygenase small subunit
MTDTAQGARPPVATGPAAGATIAGVLLQAEIANWLYTEAKLLDERAYEPWLDMLDEQLRYFAPLSLNVSADHVDAEHETGDLAIAWFDEGIETLRQRVAQLRTGEHWAEEPLSRTSHLVTNVLVERAEPSTEGARTVVASSRFIVHRSRLEDERNFFVGRRQDTFVRAASGWRLRERRIYLDEAVLTAKNLTTFL